MDSEKVYENYMKICEFLLAQACSTPCMTEMDIQLQRFTGHYFTIGIKHSLGCKAQVRVFDCPSTRGHAPQNYFYAGDDLKKIKKTVYEDRPTLEAIKALVIGWHRYGIKERILNALKNAVDEANEKLEAEKEIDNFTV